MRPTTEVLRLERHHASDGGRQLVVIARRPIGSSPLTVVTAGEAFSLQYAGPAPLPDADRLCAVAGVGGDLLQSSGGFI